MERKGKMEKRQRNEKGSRIEGGGVGRKAEGEGADMFLVSQLFPITFH